MYDKVQWRFRTQNTLGANYIWKKYCEKQIPTLVQWKESTQFWKFMLQNREYHKEHIWWEPKDGSISIWYENLSRLGPLCHLQPQHSSYPITGVDIFIIEKGWNMRKRSIVYNEVLQRVKIRLDLVKQTKVI